MRLKNFPLALFACTIFSCSQSTPTHVLDAGSQAKDIGITLDFAVASSVANALDGTASLPADFESLTGVKLLVQRDGGEVTPPLTTAGLKSAINDCMAGTCAQNDAIDLKAAKDNVVQAKAALALIQGKADQLATETTNIVGAHIPDGVISYHQPVYIIFGGKTDAYNERMDDHWLQAVELTSIVNSGSPEKYFRMAVDHEMWHAVFLTYVEKNWKMSDPSNSENADYQLVFQMLNEGFGHYMSILAAKTTDEDTRSTLRDYANDLSKGGFYKIYKDKMPAYLALQDDQQKIQMIIESISGDMFKKWGAMTGALVIAELKAKIGLPATLDLFKKEPYSLWLKYQEVADQDFRLDDGFIALVKKLAEAENSQH